MALALVVAVPFDTYKIGDQITDPAKVEALLASEHSRNCRRVNLPDDNQTGS